MTLENRRRRILFIDSGLGKGGSSTFLYYMLKYLDRSRFDPCVAFYFQTDGPDVVKLKALDIPVVCLSRRSGPRWSWLMQGKIVTGQPRWIKVLQSVSRAGIRFITSDLPQMAKLWRLLRRQPFSLVVLNNDVHYHLVGTLAARLAGLPIVCRKAGGIGEGKVIKRLLTPVVDLFVVVSRATEADQRANNPGTKKLVTVYEGIDLKCFMPLSYYPLLREELSIPAGTKVIGYVSRFHRGKGHKEFLEAAALVAGSFRDVVFLIVGEEVGGDSGLRGELLRCVEDLRLQNHVIFTGWREDIEAILSIMDIYVHCPTTWIEGLGIANLEAMAMGKPTVVSDNGGLPDAVIDGETGFVVPIGDVTRLADVLLRLLRDDSLAQQLGRNARRRVEEHFDIAKNTATLEECLDAVALP